MIMKKRRRKHNNYNSTCPTVNDNKIFFVIPVFFEKMPTEWKGKKDREWMNEWMNEWEWEKSKNA